jgi:hypothetical protein
MSQPGRHVTIPLQIMAHLPHLSGDEFKSIGALCYLMGSARIEQIEQKSGIAASQIKPVLQRLIRRGWLIQEGNNYRLAFKSEAVVDSDLNSTLNSTDYDPALGIRPARVTAHLLYPEGPWLTESGLLDADFLHDRAAVWRTGDHYQAKSFGAMAIEDVVGVLCKYYAKPENHGSLEIDWHSYWAKNQRYLANMQQRLQSGAQIQPDEQKLILNKLYLTTKAAETVYEVAVQKVLPLDLPPPVLAAASSIAPQLSAESLPDALRHVVKSMPTVDPAPTIGPRRIDQLKRWLADPILRADAEKTAKAHGYEVFYNELGIPIDLVEAD